MIEELNKILDSLGLASWADLEAMVSDYRLHNDVMGAYHLYRQLRSVRDDWPKNERAVELERLLLTLRWLAFPELDDVEVIRMVGQEMAEGLTMEEYRGFALGKFKMKLANIPLAKRDFFKKILLDKLLENNEHLGDFFIGEDGEKRRGTLGNWLRDYRKFKGEGKPKGLVGQTEYLNKKQKVNIFSEQMKRELMAIFAIDDYLSSSSFTLSGREEPLLFTAPDGAVYGAYNGEIFKVDYLKNVAGLGRKTPARLKPEAVQVGKSVDVSAPARIVQPPDENSQNKPESIEEKMGKKYHDFVASLWGEEFLSGRLYAELQSADLSLWRNRFYHAVNNKDRQMALKALLVCAEKGALRKTFAEDERFVRFWGRYLKEKNLDAEHFYKDPANSRHMAMFLNYILEQKLGLTDEEAAMAGVLIANLARAAGEFDYQKIAYGDVDEGFFRWNF